MLAARDSRTKNARERATPIASLSDAFDRYQTPVENRDLIRRILDSSGVVRLVGFGDYFKAEQGSGPALEVHAGYTTGFRSESDAVRRAGDADRWPSRRFHGAWGVSHPVIPVAAEPAKPKRAAKPRASAPRTSSPRAAAAPAKPERQEKICPTCFMVMPATGICDTCGA